MSKEDLTISIATCGRPRVLRRCLRSIEKYVTYPHKINVLDNTEAFTHTLRREASNTKKKVDKYIEVTDRKIGCCESNQILADACDTKYIMHLDDDIYFDGQGVVTQLMDNLKNKDYDIVSCLWKDMYINSFREASTKHITGYSKGVKCFWKVSLPIQMSSKVGLELVDSDEALHSMVMDMDVYKKVSWDKAYAWKGDREDFFMQCKKAGLRIGIDCTKYVVHDPKPFQYGSISYEYDGGIAKQHFLKKWGLLPLFPWDQWQDKPGNPNPKPQGN